MSTRQYPADLKNRHVLVNRNCLALVLHRIKTDGYPSQEDGGHAVFADFLQQNSMCFWNACLMRSVASLEYRGCLVPTTLLISGTNFALEVVRSAWARRVLRPPKGYTIGKLGDVGTVDMLPVPQTQFAPLSEALCKVVADLNGDRVVATTESIRSRLEDSFPEMQVPCEDILHKTLGGLIRERKVYHTGNGYFIVSPDTYRQRAVSPLCERQMLMTNEEAIVRLHGESRRECSLAVQVDEMDIAAAWKCSTSSFLQARQTKATFSQSTQVPSSPDLQILERSHSLRVLRVKGRPKNNSETTTMDRGGSFKEPKKINLNDFEGDMNDIRKSEKQSMLAKILKRMQFLTDKSAKHVVFSSQFPPLEWLEADKIRCHSVATQTELLMQKVCPVNVNTSLARQQVVGTKSAVKRPEPTGLRIPWEEAQNNLDRKGFSQYVNPNMGHGRLLHSESDGSSPRKNLSLPTRQSSHSRYSPSHRYSHHGAFTNSYAKRRHNRHRRSSSESPKVQKTLLNGYQSHSSSSKSNADNSDDKVYKSFSSGSAALTAPMKEPKASATHKPPSSKEQHEWVQAINNSCCPSKDDNASCRETPSIQSPSNSLDREVLRDVKNISASHTKTPTTAKIGNIPPPHSEISGEMPGTKQNTSSISDLIDKKSSVDQSGLKNSSCSEKSVSHNNNNNSGPIKPETLIQPLVLKSFVDIPTPKPAKSCSPPKEIIIDNSVSVEVALEKSPSPKSKANNVSTTIVTEETTVTKANGNSKVVTVTSITTSLSHGGLKDTDTKRSPPEQSFLESDASSSSSSDKDKSSVNDLNIETEKSARIIDCTSSCNIVTEVK